MSDFRITHGNKKSRVPRYSGDFFALEADARKMATDLRAEAARLRKHKKETILPGADYGQTPLTDAQKRENAEIEAEKKDAKIKGVLAQAKAWDCAADAYAAEGKRRKKAEAEADEKGE